LLDDIDTTVERMTGTIERLLTLAAPTRQQMTREPVNLSTLAQEIIAELRQHEPARQVVVEIAPDMLAEGDARLLRMLLDDLLENAWKYTGKRATAEIRFTMQPHPETGASVYVVRDNGAGFDQSRATETFQAFQRLHTSSDFPGTGIGLAMVRRIVHLHGGAIWAEAARDQGAAFFFTLD
jgi:signal transduction histidine kinase